MSSLWTLHGSVFLAVLFTLIGRELLSFALVKLGVLEKSFGCVLQSLVIAGGVVLLIPLLLLLFFWHLLAEEARQDESVKKVGDFLKKFTDGWNAEIKKEAP